MNLSTIQGFAPNVVDAFRAFGDLPDQLERCQVAVQEGTVEAAFQAVKVGQVVVKVADNTTAIPERVLQTAHIERAASRFTMVRSIFTRTALFLSWILTIGVAYNELKLRRNAQEIGDIRGAELSGLRFCSHICNFLSSSCSLSVSISALLGTAQQWIGSLGMFGTVALGIGGIFGMLVYSLRLKDGYCFRKELNEAQEGKTLTNFLKEKLPHEITYENQDDGTTKMVVKFDKAKAEDFRRQSGKKSLELIENWLIKMEKKELDDVENSTKLTEIFNTIESQNTKKMLFFGVMFVVSFLSFAAFIAATVFSAGTAPLMIATVVGIVQTMLVVIHFAADKWENWDQTVASCWQVWYDVSGKASAVWNKCKACIFSQRVETPQ